MRATIAIMAAIFCIATSGTHARAAECDFEYVIQPNDQLANIAQTAYGSQSYELVYLIYLRNPSLSGKIGAIPAGEAIIIPCLEGAERIVPDTAALSAVMQSGTGASSAAEPVSSNAQPLGQTPVDTIQIVTARDLPPYSGSDLRDGGMITEMLRVVFLQKGIDNYEMQIIDDRSTHLQNQLIDGPFDIGYPWLRPECEQLDALRQLSPGDAEICDNFVFSEPFHEYVNGFYVRKGEYSDSRTTFSDLSEARICRPDGTDITDLAMKGISSPDATIVRPETMQSCVESLISGEIDAISGEVFQVETALNALGAADQVVELPNLSLLSTIHVIAPKSKPEAVAQLEVVNSGLIDLKISGEWFSIIGKHLPLQ